MSDCPVCDRPGTVRWRSPAILVSPWFTAWLVVILLLVLCVAWAAARWSTVAASVPALVALTYGAWLGWTVWPEPICLACLTRTSKPLLFPSVARHVAQRDIH